MSKTAKTTPKRSLLRLAARPPAVTFAPPGSADRSTAEPGLPSPLSEAGNALPAHLAQLADRARDYVEAASAANTRKAYASDWKHFSAWCRRQGVELLPPNPQVVGLYIIVCAEGTASGATIAGRKPNSVTTIERRLSAISWNYAQRGTQLDRKDRHGAGWYPQHPRQPSPAGGSGLA